MQDDEFLKRVPLGWPVPWSAFWGPLVRKHGKPARDFQAVLQARADGCNLDPYPYQYASLDLYLATSGQFMGPSYRAYLARFRTLVLSPSRVLDLGCGGGLLACAYATFFPEAQVVGVDRCQEAIAVARQLAARMGLSNVTFHQADLRRMDTLPGAPFDLVTSFHLIHEILPQESPPDAFLLREVRPRRPGPRRQAVIDWLRAVVAPGGHLVSVERLPYDHATLRWGRTLAKAGLEIDPGQSAMLTVPAEAPHVQERFPMLVARQRPGRVLCPPSRILDLHATSDQGDLGIFEGARAERMFLALRWCKQLASKEIQHGDGVEWRELWQGRGLLLLWVTTSLGYRRLELWPEGRREEVHARVA